MPSNAIMAVTVLLDRTLPGTGASGGGSGELSSLNVLIIVGGAVLITFLARYLSRRGRGGKK